MSGEVNQVGQDQDHVRDIATLQANVTNIEGWIQTAVSRIENQIDKLIERLDRTCPVCQAQVQVLQVENTNLKSEVDALKLKLSDYDDYKGKVKLIVWIGSIVATALTGALVKLLIP